MIIYIFELDTVVRRKGS